MPQHPQHKIKVCVCKTPDMPDCEDDARVPPMPELPVIKGKSTVDNDAEEIEEYTRRSRKEPLVSLHRKMARFVETYGPLKTFIHANDAMKKAAESCPCRRIEQRPLETADEKLVKRLAVMLFLARQPHNKENDRQVKTVDVQNGNASGAACPSSNEREVPKKTEAPKRNLKRRSSF